MDHRRTARRQGRPDEFLFHLWLPVCFLVHKKKYQGLQQLIANKTLRLLVPYFIWSCIMIASMPQLKLTWLNLLTGVAHLWFLLVLFIHFLIIALLWYA